ncbi:helix-turn-helix transcriptional regulator [Fulvimarina sp. MAC3]|uniref:helix-turn-helix domain-containing protein n=1 Tax=Fulvimarina sp. MAC3 TaxID=3148887 RepID=UPI0031FBC3FC
MPDLDKNIIQAVRAGLAKMGWSVKDLGEATGIPYRSLQNYMMGRTRMPASTLVAISRLIDLEIRDFDDQKRRMHKWHLYDALWTIFGDQLPNLPVNVTNTNPFTEDSEEAWKLHNRKQEAARALAEAIDEQCEYYRGLSRLTTVGLHQLNDGVWERTSSDEGHQSASPKLEHLRSRSPKKDD